MDYGNLDIRPTRILLTPLSHTLQEFRGAARVERGNGASGGSPSNTRCAALSCGTIGATGPIKAEQNLSNKIRYIPNQSIVLFRFLPQNDGADGVAARIAVVYDDGNTNLDPDIRYNYANATTRSAMRRTLTSAELRAVMKNGGGHEHLVHANLLFTSQTELLGQAIPMSQMGLADRSARWDLEDKIDEEGAAAASLFNATLPRSLPENTAPLLPGAIPEHKSTPLLKTASARDLQAARDLVKKSRAQSNKLNKARFARPLRNKYSLKPGTVVGGTASAMPPLLDTTEEIAAVAALIAEADAKAKTGNFTKRAAAATGTDWMGSQLTGMQVVFRNVLDYGAVGDGVTDDTAAINKATGTNETRCAAGCNGSTTKNAIVIGDANNRPRIVAAPNFVGLGVLSTDEYTGAPGAGSDHLDPEWYINTSNFYRQLRNLVIDIRQVTTGAIVTCIHYQVAQATSTQNVELIAASGSEQIDMFAENGSGGSLSDITFTGGGTGLKGGSQQFTAQRLTFNGCTVAVQTIRDWGWVWQDITMNGVGTGFLLAGEDGSGNIGSISVLDSSFTDVQKAIVAHPITSTPGQGSTGIVLENVALSGVGVAVADTAGKMLLSSSGLIDQWAIGPIYEGSTSARSFSQGGKIGSYRRDVSLLDGQGKYFQRAKPQYEDQAASAFMHTKDLGCAGDGSTDDTAAFQSAIYASLGKILFVDAGSYILTSTITIPSGAKIVGETWSQLVASGPYFSDASKPKVLVQVGAPRSVGDVEVQDLLFTTRGPTADCHTRVGGATGTELTPAECPPATSGIDSGCSAASVMMHLTRSASGYFENMWLWGADHMIDDPDLVGANNTMVVQTSIYVDRGFLIETTKPTWLYGTVSEHSVFYQDNFHKAANIYAGMLQTESPYYQPTPQPPAPFASVVGVFPGDPSYDCAAGDDFGGCDSSWAIIMTGCQNIFVSAAGIYSWFTTYSQACIGSHVCQTALMLLQNNLAGVRISNLTTIGAKYMAVVNGKGILATDNLNVEEHPAWSQISILEVSGNGTDQKLWIDPTIWDMDQPQFTCSPPCNVQIPPWTGATSTVNYPLLTVSSGSWTSTITRAPLVITEWVLEVETILPHASNNNKLKRADQTIKPTPATTPFWPAVVYNGADGRPTTTSAQGPFPTPPPSFGQSVKAVEVVFGSPESPLIEECGFLDFEDPLCITQPWFFGNKTGLGAAPNPGDLENVWDLKTMCPRSSSTSTTTTVTPPRPTPSPLEQGDARTNTVKCYNSDETTEGERMHNAARSFCGIISKDGLQPGYFRSMHFPFPYNGGIGIVDITISLEIKPRCSFIFSETLGEKYLSVPTDSCNCGGVNGKQGGICGE
ncbi:glycoside hydrolase family 55 protein [Xylariaceae sp. AK1471]|nr:glycoside hydrolase family 55 protein [Xylariaceae sp. AK1471]